MADRAELQQLDREIDEAEKRQQQDGECALLWRWRFGRALLAEREAHGGKQLPHGRIAEVAKFCHKSQAEISDRVKFAAEYDTEEKVSDASETFGSWRAITHRGLGRRGSEDDSANAARLSADLLWRRREWVKYLLDQPDNFTLIAVAEALSISVHMVGDDARAMGITGLRNRHHLSRDVGRKIDWQSELPPIHTRSSSPPPGQDPPIRTSVVVIGLEHFRTAWTEERWPLHLAAEIGRARERDDDQWLREVETLLVEVVDQAHDLLHILRDDGYRATVSLDASVPRAAPVSAVP